MSRASTTIPSALLVALALALLAVVTPAQDTPDATPANKARLSRLQGRLTVDRSNRVIGATVFVTSNDGARRLYLTASGEDGDFRVDGLPDGSYRVQLSREGYAPVTKEDISLKFPFRAVVEVRMEPGLQPPVVPPAGGAEPGTEITLSGRVVGQGDGDPLADVRVRLVRRDGVEDPHFVRTGDNGGFALEGVDVGVWSVEVQGIGFLPLRQRLDLTEDTELQVLMVSQPAGYLPSPLDLMPSEDPIPPPGWERHIVPREGELPTDVADVEADS